MSGIVVPPYNFITFDGQSFADFGVRVSGAGTYGSPERDIEEIEVPGRSGTLIFDNGRFKNIDITYNASILAKDKDEYLRKIQTLRSFLSSRIGYKRLEDTYRRGEYRLASFNDGLAPGDEVLLRGSEFDLKFNCKPQRFLKEGERKFTFSSNGSIYNPTYFDSKPLIRIYGSGTVKIGEYGITVTQPSTVNYVDVDSEMMDCYSGSVNCNDCVTLTNSDEFPVLVPGKNGVALTGVTKIELTPRWYVL